MTLPQLVTPKREESLEQSKLIIDMKGRGETDWRRLIYTARGTRASHVIQPTHQPLQVTRQGESRTKNRGTMIGDRACTERPRVSRKPSRMCRLGLGHPQARVSQAARGQWESSVIDGRARNGKAQHCRVACLAVSSRGVVVKVPFLLENAVAQLPSRQYHLGSGSSEGLGGRCLQVWVSVGGARL